MGIGNPVKDHFVCELIKDYYLDAEGYAIRERCGHVRYYYKHEADYYWGNSKQEVLDQVEPLGAFSYEELTQEEKLKRVTSFSFVQLTAKDNPIGMKANPNYMASLEALDKVKKARNLHGNWFIEEDGGSVFKRSMIRGDNGCRVKSRQDVPEGCVAIRGVDKAYSECSDKNADPDYTAISPKLLKDRNGFYWLLGEYHNDVTDKVPFKKSDNPVVGRFRKLPGERDELIRLQIETDNANREAYKHKEVHLALSKDSGGGSGDHYSTLALMTEHRIKVVEDKTISNVTGKKMTDFIAFTSACERGLVFIVEETFEPRMLEVWYKELEAFNGEASTRLRKDDHVDAIALAFNCMTHLKRPYKTPAHATVNGSPTLSADLLNRKRNNA